jgi:hypothetical protein
LESARHARNRTPSPGTPGEGGGDGQIAIRKSQIEISTLSRLLSNRLRGLSLTKSATRPGADFDLPAWQKEIGARRGALKTIFSDR